jgi:hypothetical protein
MRFVILTALLMFFQVPPVATQEAGKSATTRSSPTVNPTNSPPAPSEPYIVNVGKIPAVTVTPPKRDWADWGYWIFSALLVVVGSFQVGLLWRTLGAIRTQASLMERQAEANEETVAATRDNAIAAKDGAEAAKANAEAAKASANFLINTERAWVDARLMQNQGYAYTLVVTNCGRTVAKIKEWSLSPKTAQWTGAVPPPEELFEFSSVMRRSKLLPPSDKEWPAESFNLALQIGDSVVNRARRKEIGIAYYGVIRYDDISDKPHETFFCYWYNAASDSLTPVEAPEYNRHT